MPQCPQPLCSTLWPGGTGNLPSPAQSRPDLRNLRGFSGGFHWLLCGGRLLSGVFRVFIIWILVVIGLTFSFWVLKSKVPIRRRKQMYYQSSLSTTLPQLGWRSRCHEVLSGTRAPQMGLSPQPLPEKLNRPRSLAWGWMTPHVPERGQQKLSPKSGYI